jgi:hypothetical protein
VDQLHSQDKEVKKTTKHKAVSQLTVGRRRRRRFFNKASTSTRMTIVLVSRDLRDAGQSDAFDVAVAEITICRMAVHD